jgi:hypothetical protein
MVSTGLSDLSGSAERLPRVALAVDLGVLGWSFSLRSSGLSHLPVDRTADRRMAGVVTCSSPVGSLVPA